MKLGAQFYSIRDVCKTPEELRQSFRRIKEIGYDSVQISGVGESVTAKDIAACVAEFDLPAASTHSPFERIVHDTDALIAEHKLFGASEIGIGGLGRPKDLETARAQLTELRFAAQKIRAAGLTFAFHNHSYEFADLGGGVSMFTIMAEECPEINFIFDVYWAVYAGQDPVAFIRRFGNRMTNIHFKDMKTAPQGPICPCGEGIIDFVPIYDACREVGIQNVFVEQDNAPDFGDSIGQMAVSYKNLAPLFGK